MADKPLNILSRSKLVQRVLNLGKYRWIILGSLVIFILIFESVTHNKIGKPFYQDLNFWYEAIFYGLVMPVIVSSLFELWKFTWHEKRRISDDVAEKERISDLLSQPHAVEELINTILQIPTIITPVIGSSLYLYTQDSSQFVLVKTWSQDTSLFGDVKSVLKAEDCPCLSAVFQGVNAPTGCTLSKNESISATHFCLPLVHAGQTMGLLQIAVLPDITLPVSRIKLLYQLAPQMASALHYIKLQQKASQQEEVISYVQHQISRDLHDTLGQSLSLLLLKLDVLSSTHTLKDIEEIQSELGKMHEVAEDAYHQIRGFMANLLPTSSQDISLALSLQAKTVQSRTGLNVSFKSMGQAVDVSPSLQHQVLYICMEALNNIEKHSHAEHVFLDIYWEADQLLIKIRDDGVGFDPKNLLSQGMENMHYGLKIMQERAKEIQGNLELDSIPGHGTTFQLSVPIWSVQNVISLIKSDA